ncbi:MAG: hypothetical protein V7K88_13510 [Nostoc sp.]|uniref:hypothetical protein n=1 Tax=Nostoc sp. TaxID=1180 RepID=UPI002FF6D16F
MPNPEIPEKLTAEDLMSEEFWRSHGIEPVYIDPNDDNSFKQVAERIEAEVNKIREKEGK